MNAFTHSLIVNAFMTYQFMNSSNGYKQCLLPEVHTSIILVLHPKSYLTWVSKAYNCLSKFMHNTKTIKYFRRGSYQIPSYLVPHRHNIFIPFLAASTLFLIFTSSPVLYWGFYNPVNNLSLTAFSWSFSV
jgi:hypothetical protein